MDMRVVKSEKCLCTCCMEEHEVKTVIVHEHVTFKNVKVEYEAVYLYCDAVEELYMDEQQMQENYVRIMEVYRTKVGLVS